MTIRIQTGIIISIFLSLMLIASSFGIVSFQFASAQASSDDNNTNSLNVQDIPIQKVHVGDIDIAYKVFGKGDPILLLTGSNAVMDTWDPTILRDLSSNHILII